MVLCLVTRTRLPGGNGWLGGVAFGLAAMAALVCVGRRLPLQNVVAVGLVVAGLAATVLGVCARGDLPPYTPEFGPKLLRHLPWQMPLLWVALVLSARDTGRLMLRPWRRARYYGLGLNGVSALLVVGFGLAFEPFGSRVAGWWAWPEPAPGLAWFGAPWYYPLVWLVLALAAGAFATPWLIMKRPLPVSPDLHPLWVWLGLMGMVVLADVAGGCWAGALVGLVVAGTAGVLGWRGWRFARLSLPTGGSASNA